MGFNYKCINEIVAELVEELGLNDQRMRPMLLQWIYEGQSEIGATALQEKESEWLPIIDYKLKKPKDFMFPRQIQIKAENGRCLTPRLEARRRCCPCENFDVFGCDVIIQEYPTYYGLSTNAKEYDKYKMLYVSTPVGDDGLPMVDENSVKAVKQYALYKFLQKQRRSFPERVPMSEIDFNLRLWQKYKDQAWSRQMWPDDASLPSIAKAAWYSGITPQDFNYALGNLYSGNGYVLR